MPTKTRKFQIRDRDRWVRSRLKYIAARRGQTSAAVLR